MLRKYLIQKHLNYHSETDIKYIVWHSSWAYFKGAGIAMLLLFFLYLAYALLNKSHPAEYRKVIFAILWLIVFLKWIIDFLDVYLDCLILTQNSLTLFLREGLLEYKTEVFFRNKLSSLSWNQKGIWDKVFLKWDLVFTLEHDLSVAFQEVYMPQKWLTRITLLKQTFLDKEKENLEKDLAEDQENFWVLVEAMWEVVREYLGKNKK